MLFDELKNSVEKLSKHYEVFQYSNEITTTETIIFFKERVILFIGEINPCDFKALNDLNKGQFGKLPFSKKLWMLAAEYAMTPIDERQATVKFRVHLISGFLGYVNYYPESSLSKINFSTAENCSSAQTIFSQSQYEELRQTYTFLPEFSKDNPVFEFIDGPEIHFRVHVGIN